MMAVAGGTGVGGGSITSNVPPCGETCTSGEYTHPLLYGAPAYSIWTQSPPADLPSAGAVAPRNKVPTIGYTEELGPIRTLIWGSSVITVMNMPVEDAWAVRVSVGCWASTTVEVDAKRNVQRETRTMRMVKIAG